MPLTSDSIKRLPLALFLIITTITHAQTSPGGGVGGGKVGPSSVELADLLHTETVIIENLRNYVDALDSKISAIKRKTQEIRRIHDVALNDTGKYFGNPINAFKLIKRMTHEWAAMRNFAGKDVTGHIVENITEFRETLSFPTEEDLDESVGGLLRIQDVYQMEPPQVGLGGEFDGMKFGSQMTWSDCLTIGQQSFQQGEHLVARVWLQTALERVPQKPQTPLDVAAKVEVLETLANAEYQTGNIKKALRLVDEILELQPKNKRAIASQARFREKLKKQTPKQNPEQFKIPTARL